MAIPTAEAVVSAFESLMQDTSREITQIQALLVLRSQAAPSTQNPESRLAYESIMAATAEQIRHVEARFNVLEDHVHESQSQIRAAQEAVKIIESQRERTQEIEALASHLPSHEHVSSPTSAPHEPEQPDMDGSDNARISLGAKIAAVPTPIDDNNVDTEEQLQPQEQPKPTKPALPKCRIPSEEEFGAVPKYQRGRLAYARMELVGVALNRALAKKYKTMRSSKETRKSAGPALRAKIAQWKSQQTKETKGSCFITVDDITVEAKRDKLDINTIKAALLCLRHCACLKHVSGGGVQRLVVQTHDAPILHPTQD